MLKTLFILATRTAAGCLVAATCVAATTPPCPELQGKKPANLLAYLDRDRAALSPDCIVYAIRELGAQQYVAAVNTLAMYLDFRMPGTEKKVHDVTIVRIPTLGDKYPAVVALFEIGKPALPSLVHMIGHGATSDLLRNNALEVVLVIHRENMAEAVRALSHASRTSSDSATAIRLWDAARKEASRCPGEIRNHCEDALLEQNRN